MNVTVKKIQDQIDEYLNNGGTDIGELNDGDHSFKELYDHRVYLTALAINNPDMFGWKSLKHHDGTMYEGYFIVGFPTEIGMVTYHYPLEYWNIFKVPEFDNAPHWDPSEKLTLEQLKRTIEFPSNKEKINQLLNYFNEDQLVKFPLFGLLKLM